MNDSSARQGSLAEHGRPRLGPRSRRQALVDLEAGLRPLISGKGENRVTPGTKDQIQGNLHEVEGKVKEKAGQILNKPDSEAEGQAENLAGNVQKKIGQNEKVFE